MNGKWHVSMVLLFAVLAAGVSSSSVRRSAGTIFQLVPSWMSTVFTKGDTVSQIRVFANGLSVAIIPITVDSAEKTTVPARAAFR